MFVSGKFPNICRAFTAADVIDRLCGTSRRFSWSSDAERLGELSDPIRVAVYLELLGTTPLLAKSRAHDIKHCGMLPLSGGGSDIWRSVLWTPSDPPTIPGVSKHTVIHPHLRNYQVLKSGSLALSRFDIEDRLSTLDWRPVVDPSGEKYLVWLTQNAKRLRRNTLSSIMAHPVFQASDGSFHTFAALCSIGDAQLREAMSRHVKMPSANTIALVRVRPGALKLRTIPSVSETRGWYQSAAASIAQHINVLGPQELEILDHVEATIERLLRISDRALGNEIRGWKHRTLSRSGRLRPMNELHEITEAVSACRLSDDDLVGSTRAATWKNFGLRDSPSGAAIYV